MNLRMHKRLKQTQIGLLFKDLWAGRHLLGCEARPAVVVPQPKVSIYKVLRVKDNVVMLETESRDAAHELIEKHARQKKAKLFLADGEPFQYAV